MLHVVAHGRDRRRVCPAEFGTNKLDVSLLEWLGAVEVTPIWPDLVRDPRSGPIVSGVRWHAREDANPVLTALSR